MNKVMIGMYAVVIIFFVYKIFLQKMFGNKGGKSVLIHLYNYVNGEPIFDRTIKGYIKKRFSDESDEQLLLPLKPKLWTAIPDSKYCRISNKGQKLYSLCLDGEDNFYWMYLEKTKMREITETYKVPVVDDKGNEQYEDAYERDSEGEVVYEQIKENGEPVMQDGEPVYEPKIVKQIVTKTKEITKHVPALYEQIIEANVKLYYLNKKQELREKYKVEQKKSRFEVVAPMAILAVVLIVTFYMSFNHLKGLSEDNKETTSFLQKMVEDMSSNPPQIGGGKDSSDAKPANYGKKEEGGG